MVKIANSPVRNADALQRRLAEHAPGDVVTVRFRRRDGTSGLAKLTLVENPQIQIVPIEQTGEALSGAQQRFRNEWLGSRRR